MTRSSFFLLLVLWGHGAAVSANSGGATRSHGAAENSKKAHLLNHPRQRLGTPTAGKKVGLDESSGYQDQAQINIQPRIVGGGVSERGEFPYFVDMLWCGGVLIAPEVVLSAGHCESYAGQDVLVSGYEWASTGSGAILKRIVDGVLHPRFDTRTLDNDFYLHRLDSKVTLRTDITLRLNEEETVPTDNQDLTVMGLGHTQDGGSRPERLNDVEVQYIPTNECNRDLKGEISENMFCAGVDGGGKDSCNGDSGSPIVIRDGDIHTVVGLVSWGYGCAEPNSPGVYSRLSSAMGWIREVVCDEWEMEASLCGDPTSEPSLDPMEGATTNVPATNTTTPPLSITAAPTNDKGSDTLPPTVPSDPLLREDEFSNSTDCIELEVKLRTDRWPSENTLTITEVDVLAERDASQGQGQGQSPMLLNITNTELEASTEYLWKLCMDWNASNQTCTVLNFTDSVGDGLADMGNLLVTWDGEVVYDEWNVGSGAVLELGDACLGE